MPHEIRVPRLGWSMEEGTFVGWLKQPGDDVAVGDPLYELEGEKALQQIESVDAGRLFVAAEAPAPGAVVAVGAILGYLLAPGEAPPQEAAPSPDPPTKTAANDGAPNVAKIAVETSPVGAAASVGSAESSAERVASPRARRVAAELHVDWRTITGTGRGGRVREEDVRRAAAAGDSELVWIAADVPAMARMARRRTIAARLRRCHERAVPVTLTTRADPTRMIATRDQMRGEETGPPTYSDFFVRLAALVLRRHPLLRVYWDESGESLIDVPEERIDIGVAVDTADGLLAPVVRNAAGKSLRQVAEESRALVERARAGRLSADEMRGGVLTISNLGGFGIDAFTPILNYPQIAILGLGAIRREPVVSANGAIAAGLRQTLSLTFDHVAIDGAPAAAFLRDLVAAVESPAGVAALIR